MKNEIRFSEMKWLLIKAMGVEIYSACESAYWNDDLLSDTFKVEPQK